jgi:hypothetical protein
VQCENGSVVLKVVRGKEFSEDAFQTVVRRFSEYLRGLPFSVEFHETIEPHVKSGKIKTIVVEKRVRQESTLVA